MNRYSVGRFRVEIIEAKATDNEHSPVAVVYRDTGSHFEQIATLTQQDVDDLHSAIWSAKYFIENGTDE